MASLFRKILVPYDFSPAANAALETAVGLASEHGGTLVVLHAITPVYPATPFAAEEGIPAWVPPKTLIAEMRARLEATVTGVRKRRRLRGAVCRILVGEPYRCIIAAARDADSIVLGTLGRSGLSHLLIGSVAEKVVRHAPVPVLTVRAQGGRRTRRGGAASRATGFRRSARAPRAGRL